MANVNLIYSYSVQDADGEIFAVPFYTQKPDTDTLSFIISDLQDFGVLVDVILDGAIVKNEVSLAAPLGDYKTIGDIVPGSEIERTGLFNFALTGVPGKSFSIDLPAFAYSLYIGNKINLADTDVTAFTDGVSSGDIFDATWSNSLGPVRSGKKTFRKHRKQTLRS